MRGFYPAFLFPDFVIIFSIMTNILISSMVISAVALLWRIFSREEFIAPKIEALPYLIRKPLTCGVCFSFWMSLLYIISFRPSFSGVSISAQMSPKCLFLTKFFTDWMILGMSSVFILYVFLTFWEGSHYFSHKAEELHAKNPKT